MNTTTNPRPRSRSRDTWLTLALLAAGTAFAPPAPAQTFCQFPTSPDCLYQPPAPYPYAFNQTRMTLDYPDQTGHTRSIEILVREPVGAALPMPVVIWSHGGSRGKTDASNSLPEWSEASASAGYLTVSIAHPGRPDTCNGASPPAECTAADPPGSREDLCNTLGIAVDDCKDWRHLDWDRPFDILRTLIEVEARAQGAWAGRIDLGRIAVGGHSAGSGGALSVAGAVRVHRGVPLDFPSYATTVYPALTFPVPVAYLAFSNQGPGSRGFFERDFGLADTSWDPIDAPVLLATGDGDNGCDPRSDCAGDDTPYSRRAPFDFMPGPGKYRLYLHDTDAFHNLFALKESKCDPNGPVSAAKCADLHDWLRSAALAFLDGHVRGSADALAWLAADNIVEAADLTWPGVVEWARK